MPQHRHSLLVRSFPLLQTFAEKLAKLQAAEGGSAPPAEFSLNFLWLDKNIAVAVDQVFSQVSTRPGLQPRSYNPPAASLAGQERCAAVAVAYVFGRRGEDQMPWDAAAAPATHWVLGSTTVSAAGCRMLTTAAPCASAYVQA